LVDAGRGLRRLEQAVIQRLLRKDADGKVGDPERSGEKGDIMKEKAQAGSSRIARKVENFDRIVVNANNSWAVAQDLSKHTVAFVDLDKPLERMASGVLVTIIKQ
jgi:hypothetical protein